MPRTAVAYHCSMGCPRRMAPSGGWPTCGYHPKRPTDLHWNMPTMRWMGHGEYLYSGCVRPLGPPPGFQPGLSHLMSAFHRNTGWCRRLEMQHGDTLVRFRPLTWPSQPQPHWTSWWMPCDRQMSFPILGIPKCCRPWARTPPPYPKEGVLDRYSD